eukprot:gene24358-29598_t
MSVYSCKWSLACLLLYVISFVMTSVYISDITTRYQHQIQAEHEAIGETAIRMNAYCGFLLVDLNDTYLLYALSYHDALNSVGLSKLRSSPIGRARHEYWQIDVFLRDLNYCINSTPLDEMAYGVMTKYYTYFLQHPNTTDPLTIQKYIKNKLFLLTVEEIHYVNNIRFIFITKEDLTRTQTEEHEENTIENSSRSRRLLIVQNICSSLYLILVLTPVWAFEIYKLHQRQFNARMQHCRRLLHDLKTPIACIQALIRDETGIIKTMSTILTNRILTINSIEILPNYTVVCLRSYFDHVYNLYKPMIDAIPNVDFEYRNHLNAGECVYLDEDWTMRCIENCLSNSIKFTTVGYVRLQISRTQEHLLIEIDDTGKGIPRAQRLSIVKDWIQLQQHSGGMGLGLSTVSKYMDKIKGTLQIVDNPDFLDGSKGIRVRMMLPYKKPDYETVEHVVLECAASSDPIHENVQIAHAEPNAPSLKLLLVEDDRIQRMILKAKLLKTRVYEVTEAADGSDALTKCEGTKFDSLLTDKSMPVMDGLTFLRRLKKSTNKPSLCVMRVPLSFVSET